MNENWKAIPGYEGAYEVSDLGRVRGLTRTDASGRRWQGRALRLLAHPGGYLQVNLCRGGVARMHRIHRLVLEAFVGPAPDGTEACHGDGNPANNTLGNLRWDTKSSNSFDRVRHGTHNNASKTHCPAGHLYDEKNLYLLPNGDRRCRTCKRQQGRAHMARKRARARLARGAA